MEPDFYFNELYPLQDEVLAALRSIDTEFYLSGGTAASRGYLNHRFSDDLDFFVNDDGRFELWADRVHHRLVSSNEWECRIVLRDQRFVRLFVRRAGIDLKIEMINDVPSRIGSIREHPTLGRLDTAENILANKISALLDREEPKDLADIWGFCSRLDLSIRSAIEGAQGKAAGIFPADVARALLGARESDWEIIRWIEAPSRESFLADLQRIGESLILTD